MALVTPPTVVRAARAAGWSGRDLITAVAIAYAESRLNKDAIGGPNRNGSRDYGLWQINSVHNPTAQQWRDPVVNARMAYKVWSDAGRSFKPWTTYKNRAYLLFWSPAAAAVGVDATPLGDAAATAGAGAEAVAGGIGDAAGAVPAALDQVGDVVEALGKQETWLRVAKVMTGTLLVGIGVYLVARPVVEPAAQAARKVAVTAATKGAVK